MVGLRITAFCLLIIIVALCSIWLNIVGEKWWYPPLLMMIVIIGVLFSWLYSGSKDIARVIAGKMERFLFGSPIRTSITFGILVVLIARSFLLTFNALPTSKEYLAIQVYRNSPAQGNYAAGVILLVHSTADGITRKDTIDKTGYAYISDISAPTTISVQLSEIRKNEEWIWGLGSFDINKLPRTYSYDLAQVPRESWKQITAPSAKILQTMKPVSRSIKPPTTPMKGDISFQKINAPWGLPEADLIINRYSYILGLTPARTSRWIAYAYTTSSQESSRRFQFVNDPVVPKEIQPTVQDYSNSGYEKGNLISPKDVAFKGNVAMMEAEYSTTIAPQTPALNRNQWRSLEETIRRVAASVGQVYILTGPLYLYSSTPKTIGPNKIPVPTHFFKIICWMSSGELETAAYLFPNNIDNNASISTFAVSITEIEKLARFVCLPELRTQIAESIKGQERHLPGL